MPNPGSHAFDNKRTRLRDQLENAAVPAVPDQHADDEARAELERDNPPRLVDSPRAAGPAGSGAGTNAPESTGGLEVRSSAFSDHDLIPERYTKQGDDISPALVWSGIPDDAQELALICEDPDAPSGPFLHWALVHIDPSSGGADENATPAGALALRNGFGDPGWGGPQPPVGDDPHRYFFRLYALDERLDVGSDADPAELRAAIEKHTVASGTLVGRFGR
jgi:Raf kinase inhibitor-like YbhB/YbcL family protein